MISLRRLRLILVFTAVGLTGAGCVATNYQKAPADTPPAFNLGLPAQPDAPLQASLESLIVIKGPGSWKRYAYWDEYVISVANPGRTSVRFVGGHLVDAHGIHLRPGENWEDLERESVDWFKRNATVENVALGAGMTVLVATAGAGVFIGYAAMLAGAAPVLGIAAGAVLLSGGSSYLLDRPNQDSRREIAAEFDRRRLMVPLTLRPGETLQGSLFFRITPSPQRLVLDCESGGRVQRLTIDLKDFSTLHRKPAGAGK